MKNLRYGPCCLLLLCVLPLAVAAGEYARTPLLAGPVTVKNDSVTDVQLSTPVSRRQDMAQLDIEFAEGGGYSVTRDGILTPRGLAGLVVTLAGDDGWKYTADIVNGSFHANGVMPKFVMPPPRNVRLRKMTLRGMNVPVIKQIYWVEGREKLSVPGTDEDLSNCERRRCGWREAMDYCASRGGRLLTMAELKLMYARECAGKDLETCHTGYWSSAEYAPFPRKAWYIDFRDGRAVSALKTYLADVRCLVPKSPKGDAAR